ncbi:MAG TPA: AraC family ligand binding domain-containing protein [Solirubrobacteraceae bacterium]|jgi:mannose-6-phosphate isomerase-like protein (cupin superfamily)|nr:AraC family ligand binding domain-containing protein [Solirubrobacteraceae bacterium]
MGYTIKNLESVEDMAKRHGLSEQGEARFAREDLAAKETGVSHQRLRAGMRQQFGHHHDQAEEIYVVLAGSGRVKLDEEIVEIGKLDAIRVSPETMRAFEAGDDGLEILVFGRHFGGDGEMIPGWWSD